MAVCRAGWESVSKSSISAPSRRAAVSVRTEKTESRHGVGLLRTGGKVRDMCSPGIGAGILIVGGEGYLVVPSAALVSFCQCGCV